MRLDPGEIMVPCGLEPRTLRLLAVRSNQLSYEILRKNNLALDRIGGWKPGAVSTPEYGDDDARAVPGIEPGTSRTRSENHATRPNSQLEA